MQLTTGKLTLLSMGANSHIFMYGQQDTAVALKVVQTNSKESKHLINEYTILKQLHHQYIISAFKLKRNINFSAYMPIEIKEKQEEEEFFENKRNIKHDILVLQHAKMGNMMSLMRQRKLTLPQIRFFFHQICEAAQYLHSNYIVHRDLKLQNILIFSQNFQMTSKIADFGFASSCRSDNGLLLFNSYKGTKRGYMAPQIHKILQDPQAFYDGRKSDVFALGVVLFAMVTDRLPFQYATNLLHRKDLKSFGQNIVKYQRNYSKQKSNQYKISNNCSYPWQEWIQIQDEWLNAPREGVSFGVSSTQ